MLQKHVIVGIHVSNRLNDACDVQKVLTEFGCNIRTRIGLHDADGSYCSPSGVLLLELVGDDEHCNGLISRLSSMKGLEVKAMTFDHP